MGLRSWWSSLTVAEKRILSAAGLGVAGVGVIALSRRTRPGDGESNPRIARAVSAGIAQLGAKSNPNDAADLAYWSLYPSCPEYLSPANPAHTECIQLWLEVRNEARFQLGCHRYRPELDVYPPGSQQQIQLFRQAARLAGVPDAWAQSRDLRYILSRESGGVVGIPNYTYGWKAKEASCWPMIHQELRNGVVSARSSATGLGQLLLSNVRTYYPSGPSGIGDPLEEAVGMLRYIEKRYGTPAAARACYGKGSKDAPCPVPGKRPKTFTEGY
jgi:hypothetical protein